MIITIREIKVTARQAAGHGAGDDRNAAYAGQGERFAQIRFGGQGLLVGGPRHGCFLATGRKYRQALGAVG
jgi:hypothetical protein